MIITNDNVNNNNHNIRDHIKLIPELFAECSVQESNYQAVNAGQRAESLVVSSCFAETLQQQQQQPAAVAVVLIGSSR